MIARTYVDRELVRSETFEGALSIHELITRTAGVATELSRHGHDVWLEVFDPAGETFPADDVLTIVATPWGVLSTFIRPFESQGVVYGLGLMG